MPKRKLPTVVVQAKRPNETEPFSATVRRYSAPGPLIITADPNPRGGYDVLHGGSLRRLANYQSLPLARKALAALLPIADWALPEAFLLDDRTLPQRVAQNLRDAGL